MKPELMDIIGKEILFFDGGTGSILVELGLQAGELPERWNLEHAEEVVQLHQAYYAAGAHVVNTNTFGANGLKYGKEELASIVKAAVSNAKEARRRVEAGIVLEGKLTKYVHEMDVQTKPHYIALDIGPTGKLLKPFGDLGFEEAIDVFAEVVRLGVAEGVDLIMIETMNDSYETKAAVIAAKENCDLPVFVTNVYDEHHRLLTGADPETMTAILEGLRVDALGMNCSLGPEQMKGIVPSFEAVASVPVIVTPNAGIPRSENGKTIYDVTPEDFAGYMKEIAEAGAQIMGGCCGTTPAHIQAMVEALQGFKPHPVIKRNRSVIASRNHVVSFKDIPVLIGERINPTGKKKFKEALRNHDMDYILGEGLKQEDAGCDALDVNVGLPEIDEVAMIEEVVKELQVVTDLPLQMDTTNPGAMERALRVYNGKALINSVNGKEEVMHTIFPLVKKYGGVVVGLTLDESGIPDTVEGRLNIANKIYETAKGYGIDEKDIIIDPLAMAVSADNNAAKVTLETVKQLKNQGRNTILGVSNVSFGLPAREVITSTFFTIAMTNGLSAAILNPMSVPMRQAYQGYLTLNGFDDKCLNYIDLASSFTTSTQVTTVKKEEVNEGGLKGAILKGLKSQAESATLELLKTMEPMEVINKVLIPALDEVGKGFEAKKVYLPQLLLSADAASAGFGVIKKVLESSGTVSEKKGPVVLATVKGDIHDIGKNIVKVLLENYGFEVIDLGKDVPVEKVVETVKDHHILLVGLSALMTTTVPSMEETIKQLRVECPWCKVCVGGAVLTQEYSDMIGADYYAKDAMNTVNYAQSIFQ